MVDSMRIRNSLFRLSFLGMATLTLTSAMVSAMPLMAHAAYVCPSGPGAGEVQVGTTANGSFSTVPLCEATGWSTGGGSTSGGSTGGGSAAPKSAVDPQTARMQAQISKGLGLAMDAARALKEAGDAKLKFFQKYGDPLFSGEKGMWMMSDQGDGTGKACNATFLPASGSTFVSLVGPSQQLSGMLLFQGPAIPSGGKPQVIRTVLSTNDAEPATVPAILLTMKDNSAAIIVPTDMITTMRGTTEATWITLKLDGKEVFRTEMAGIMVARDAMLKCMKAA
jgi:hypothetical protein